MSSPIKSLTIKKFPSLLSGRQKKFKTGSTELPSGTDSARELARALHPDFQYLTVAEVIERAPDCKSFRLIPDSNRGTKNLAYFAAGKYLTVFENINGLQVTRAYSISSSPKDSLDGKYELTVKGVEGGAVSNYILNNWTPGTEVKVSAPAGNFEYQPLRDAKTVIGLAGGSGITPFVSMANAVADSDEDFNLILIYGSRNEDNILFKDELDKIAGKTNKFKVVHVLSEPENSDSSSGFEKGFITSELIKKYAPSDEPYSIFICGPQQMYNYLDNELKSLGLEKKYIRRETFGEVHNPASFSDYPSDVPDTVNVTVTICDETKTVSGSTSDTVMQILEKQGIAVPSRCRSGECGFCHSHLISGKVYIPENLDYRRMADKMYDCIHPCCAFPLTDIVINVPAAK